MKRIKLAILAICVTISFSFCISTGYHNGAGTRTVEIENSAISVMTQVT
jgi:hypothetical protein